MMVTQFLLYSWCALRPWGKELGHHPVLVALARIGDSALLLLTFLDGVCLDPTGLMMRGDIGAQI